MSDERNVARYESGEGDAQEKIDIKPRLAVVDEFFPSLTGPLSDRALHEIESRDDVDKLLKKEAFTLRIEVPDQLNARDAASAGSAPPVQTVELKVDSMEVFTPGGIVKQIKESTGETNQDLRAGFLMLDATKELRAQLGGANRKNSQFVEALVQKVVEARRSGSAAGAKLGSSPEANPAKSSGFLESLNIKKAPEENR